MSEFRYRNLPDEEREGGDLVRKIIKKQIIIILRLDIIHRGLQVFKECPFMLAAFMV